MSYRRRYLERSEHFCENGMVESLEDLKKWVQRELGEISEKVKKLENKVSKIERDIYKKKVKIPFKEEDVVDKIISSEIDLSEYNYIYKLSGLPLFLTVLKISLEKFDVDGLTPPKISKILKIKFRISKAVSAENVSMALSKAGECVDRVPNPRGRGYLYRIMNAGEERLKEEISKLRG